MTKNTVGLSDADVARALSRRLSGLDSGDGSGVATPSAFLRFAAAEDDITATIEDDETHPDQPLNDFTRWDEFLAWALNTVRSSAAFAVDPQGFVIGSSGNVPEDGFEGTGAELSYVMSQADAMDPDKGGLKSVGLEFTDLRVTGFRADFGGAEGFIIAFIDADGFSAATRNQIARQLEHSFGVLL
jgi:hypothetical protein